MTGKTDAQTRRMVVIALAGTCRNEAQVADEFKLSIDEVRQIMLNDGHEKCQVCDWWFEHNELLDENGELSQCDSCG